MVQHKVTLYLHIGLWKTGTTALQEFFVRNKQLLEEKATASEYGWIP